MKKIAYLFITFCMSLAIFGSTAFARDIQLDDEESANDVFVTISAIVPEGFDERIEVYLNHSPHPLTKDYQYSMEIPLNKELVYDIVVLSSTDVEDRYEFSAPSTLNPAETKTLTIQVTERPMDALDFDETEDFSGVTEITDLDLTPLQYDFSHGQESGIIHISMKDYGVFDTVTYRLVGDEIYDITLDSEHAFQADVKLPTGSYYENSTMSYTFHDWVPENNLKFALEHAGQMGNFGKYYDVTAGGETTISDLVIYMVQGSNSMEVNANIINDSVVVEESLAIQQEHEKQELESAFPELTETIAETETIAAAQEIEVDSISMMSLILAIGGMIAGCCMIVVILYWIRKKRQE